MIRLQRASPWAGCNWERLCRRGASLDLAHGERVWRARLLGGGDGEAQEVESLLLDRGRAGEEGDRGRWPPRPCCGRGSRCGAHREHLLQVLLGPTKPVPGRAWRQSAPSLSAVWRAADLPGVRRGRARPLAVKRVSVRLPPPGRARDVRTVGNTQLRAWRRSCLGPGGRRRECGGAQGACDHECLQHWLFPSMNGSLPGGPPLRPIPNARPASSRAGRGAPAAGRRPCSPSSSSPRPSSRGRRAAARTPAPWRYGRG